MTKLQTKPSTLHALKVAAATRPTDDQLRKQRVSFVMGSMSEDSNVTRAQVEKVLAEHDGKREAV